MQSGLRIEPYMQGSSTRTQGIQYEMANLQPRNFPQFRCKTKSTQHALYTRDKVDNPERMVVYIKNSLAQTTARLSLNKCCFIINSAISQGPNQGISY